MRLETSNIQFIHFICSNTVVYLQFKLKNGLKFNRLQSYTAEIKGFENIRKLACNIKHMLKLLSNNKLCKGILAKKKTTTHLQLDV